jgi:hypothetical protein
LALDDLAERLEFFFVVIDKNKPQSPHIIALLLVSKRAGRVLPFVV